MKPASVQAVKRVERLGDLWPRVWAAASPASSGLVPSPGRHAGNGALLVACVSFQPRSTERDASFQYRDLACRGWPSAGQGCLVPRVSFSRHPSDPLRCEERHAAGGPAPASPGSTSSGCDGVSPVPAGPSCLGAMVRSCRHAGDHLVLAPARHAAAGDLKSSRSAGQPRRSDQHRRDSLEPSVRSRSSRKLLRGRSIQWISSTMSTTSVRAVLAHMRSTARSSIGPGPHRP